MSSLRGRVMHSHTWGNGQPGLPRWPLRVGVRLIFRLLQPYCCCTNLVTTLKLLCCCHIVLNWMPCMHIRSWNAARKGFKILKGHFLHSHHIIWICEIKLQEDLIWGHVAPKTQDSTTLLSPKLHFYIFNTFQCLNSRSKALHLTRKHFHKFLLSLFYKLLFRWAVFIIHQHGSGWWSCWLNIWSDISAVLMPVISSLHTPPHQNHSHKG